MVPIPKHNEYFDAVSNDSYVNSLKFFHRQFGHVVKSNESSPFLLALNKFVENQNVYRQMLIEFIKNVYTNIKLNVDLTNRIDQFLTTFGKNSIDYIVNLTKLIEKPCQMELDMSEYLNLVDEFMCAIDQFISSEQIITNEGNNNGNNNNINDENNIPVISNRRDYNDFVRNLIQKPNHHKNLFDFSKYLMVEFHQPKSLKELARFKLRKEMFDPRIMGTVRYTQDFLKSNHMERCVASLRLPKNLADYLLHR
jgi:hypothetical protein